MLVSVLSLAAFADDAADLAAALDVPAADLTSATYTGAADANAVRDALGVIVPFTPPDLALLSTGEAGDAFPQPGRDFGAIGEVGDRTILDLELLAPIDAFRFEVRVNFLSAEYPEFVGSQFNDKFNVNVTGSAWSGDASKDDQGRPISVNSAFFGVTSAEALEGTGFEGDAYSSYSYYDYYGSGLVGAGTGWVTLAVPVTPGEPLEVAFVIRDVGDGTFDSTVAIDDFRWSTVPLDEPAVIAPPAIDWLTPKRGPVEGGGETEIRGRNFDVTCFAVLGGNVADDTVFVDSHHLRIVAAPHEAGLVDVRVDCEDGETALNGAYTYYDVPPDGLEALRILEVAPWSLPLDGGDVTLTVEGLVDGVSVKVGGEAVAATPVDATHLSFTAPPHAGGVVDVDVTSPDGRYDVRVGALFYMDEDARLDTRDTDVGYDTGGTPGCACGGSSAPPWAALVLLMLASRRRS